MFGGPPLGPGAPVQCLSASGKASMRPTRTFPPFPHPFKNLNSKRDVGVENRILLRPSTKKISHPDSGWGGKFVFRHPEMWVLLKPFCKTGFSTPIHGCLLRGGKSRFAWTFHKKIVHPALGWGGEFVFRHPEMWVLLEPFCKTGFSTLIHGCLLRGGKSRFA